MLPGPKVIKEDDEPTQPQESLTTQAPFRPELGHGEDGLPLLPVVDPEEIPMKDVKQLLAEYVRLSWSMCFKHENYCCFVFNPTSVASLPCGINPQLSHMDALHSEQRLDFLKNTAPFSSFRTLDPTRMAVSEVLEAFKLIVLGQANNSRVFDFLLTRENIPHSAVINSDNDDHDDEIQKLPDPESAVTRESQVSLLDQFWINRR